MTSSSGFPGGAPTPPYGVNQADPAPPPPAPPAPPGPTDDDPKPRRPKWWVVAVGVIGIVALVGAAVWMRNDSTEPAAPTPETTTTIPEAEGWEEASAGCDGAVTPGEDTLADATPVAVAKLPAGEGIFGEPLWAATGPAEGEMLGVFGDSYVITDQFVSNQNFTVIGRDVATGAKKWALNITQTATLPLVAVGDGVLYVGASDQDGTMRVATVDLSTGERQGCVKLSETPIRFLPTATGFLATDGMQLSRYTNDTLTWSVPIQYETLPTLLGENGSVVFMAADIRTPNPKVVGLDVATGAQLWVTPLTALTADSISLDGSPRPGSFTDNGSLASVSGTLAIPTFGLVQDDAVSLTMEIEAGTTDAPMWVFQIDNAGQPRLVAHALSGYGPLLPAGEGTFWLPPITSFDNITRGTFTQVGPGVYNPISGPALRNSFGSIQVAGDLMLAYGPPDPANPFDGETMAFRGTEFVGKVKVFGTYSGNSPYSLRPPVWAGVHVTPGPSYMFVYQLNVEGQGGGTGQGGGSPATPAPAPQTPPTTDPSQGV